MEREGLTFSDLAYLTGISRPHLSRIVHGHVVPSRKAALRIAKALGLRPEDIPAEPLPEVVST